MITDFEKFKYLLLMREKEVFNEVKCVRVIFFLKNLLSKTRLLFEYILIDWYLANVVPVIFEK